MIRTSVKPQNQNILIELPVDFIGKQIEVIAFTVDEASDPNATADPVFTHFATENVLSKDWLTPEEDAAWQDL